MINWNYVLQNYHLLSAGHVTALVGLWYPKACFLLDEV